MASKDKRYERTVFTEAFPVEITDFLESLTLKGATCQNFTLCRRHLYLFVEYLKNLPVTAVGYKEAQGFISYLADEYSQYSAGYINNIVKSVRRFYKWEKSEGRRINDPFLYVKTPRISRSLPRHVPKDRDMKLLISSIPRTNYRDRAILELLYGSGIRAGELLSLTVDMIDFEEAVVKVWDSKNSKERMVPLNDLTVYALRDYLAFERPKLMKSSPLQNRKEEIRLVDKSRLFLKEGGFPLCTWSLSELIEKYRKKSGLKSRLTPHCFRHACATEMLKGGASIRYVQVMLGHDDISTTMIYTRLGVDELIEKLDKVHPHGGKI